MLRLTKKLDYSILILVHLCRYPDRPISAKEIAETYSLSRPLVANLLKSLSREDLVESTRGKHGGYHLLLAPKELTLGMLITVLEGPFQLTECSSHGIDDDTCSLQDICPSKGPLQMVHKKIYSYLENTNFDEIAFPEKYLQQDKQLVNKV